jgi:hypothetical protein
MSTPARRRLGLALIIIAVLGGSIMALAPATMGYTQIMADNHQEGPNSWWSVIILHTTKTTVFWHPYWHRLVPSFALMLAGIACLARPPRKLPQMTS